jgi:membrane-bound lytic murein transglycosylase D
MRQTIARLTPAILLLAALIADPRSSLGAEPALFTRPPELEPLVLFWVEVFTQIDGDRTIIHDEDDPSIRYETVSTAGMNERARRDFVRERRVHYVKVLESLALKAADRRGDEEKRVAGLFAPGAGPARFLEAAGKIRSQRGIRDQFLDGLIRSGRWKPTIEGIFRAYGIPTELAALPHVESSYNPEATSKAGAVGVWQFTNSTGRRFLRIDRYVDERKDVYLSTHAAARYLKEAHAKLESWPLTVTSYNHGVEGVLRAKREVDSSDLVRLIQEYDGPYFGFASKNFYAEFLAVLQVLKEKESHFGQIQLAPLEEVDRFVLPGAARLSVLARAFSTPEEEFLRLNPALLRPIVEGRVPTPAGTVINLPAGRVPDLAAAFSSLPPSDQRAAVDPGGEYHVRTGDTLGAIARRHGISIAALQEANGLGSSTRIRPGQRLTIPEPTQ